MTTRVPIKHLFEVSRNMVMPNDYGNEPLFHYSLPAWHEHGDGIIENASDLASGKLLLKGGEVLVSKLNPEKSAVLLADEHDIPTVCSPEFIALVPKKIDRTFAYYFMLSAPLRHQLNASVESVTNSHKRARVDRFLASTVGLPDLATQRQIADFLDRETARIDLLIEKKQRLVALLREKAKSVNELFFINEGATGTQPLHRLYRVVTGKTPSRNEEDNFSVEDGLPWATPANLGFLAPVVTTKEYLTEKGSAGQPVVDAGTVLLNGIGASVGKIGIAGTRLSFNQQIHALIPKKKVLADRFLFFQLLTLKEQLVLLANSTTLPILNAERLGRLELKIFDLEEQRRHCANMDALLRHGEITAQRINTSIDRLKEYRSALITAAVTGQIDVSTYAKSGTPDRRLDAIQEEMGA